MKLKIYITNEEDQVTKEFTCVTDSIPRALQMYEKECSEFEHVLFKVVQDKAITSRNNGKRGGRPKAV